MAATDTWTAAQEPGLPFGCLPGAPDRSLLALEQAIRPLTTVLSLMNVGAHPDDELSALLAMASRGLGVRTISVIATRGEGGQNLIGPERDRLLGLLRTRELEEASRLLGVRLRFLGDTRGDPIYDFGFSRSPEETLQHWGAEHTLRRLVRVIREERPDVVVTSFRDEYGQHGHHRAITRLTLQAARIAGDPAAFPEQLSGGLGPWTVKKVYVPANPAMEAGDVYLSTEPGEPTVVIDLGRFDEALGLSYAQLGEASRRLHRSQGMGRRPAPGPQLFYAELVHATGQLLRARAAERSLFDGLAWTVGDLAGGLPAGSEAVSDRLTRIHRAIEAIVRAFPDRSRVLEATHRALAEVRALLGWLDAPREAHCPAGDARAFEARLPGELAADLRFRLKVKEGQLARLSAVAALLVAELESSAYELTPGDAVTLRLRAYNGGQRTLRNVRLELQLPAGWSSCPAGGQEEPQPVGPHQVAERAFRVHAPPGGPYFDPYHLPEIRGVVHYELDGEEGGAAPVSLPVELPRPLALLPEVSVAFDPDRHLFNLQPVTAGGSPPALSVDVLVRHHGRTPREVAVRLNVERGDARGAPQPAPSNQWTGGWDVEPDVARVGLEGQDVRRLTFMLRPRPGLVAGRWALRASVAPGTEPARAGASTGEGTTVQAVEYPHVGRTHLLSPAVASVQVFAWQVAPVRVGYVTGGFDSVPDHLRRMGVSVRLLSPQELRAGDLGAYDTIVVGLYAYGARDDLRAANRRLLDYVQAGGHLVVQLHRPQDGWDPERTPPYRLEIGRPSFRWRVTDETAPVEILEPAHPLFRWPNAIGPSDWDGWVKERGLYFPMSWAPEFVPLVATGDPGHDVLKGGMLFARFGKGSYLYTSLSWHYQLDHLVPGAFRMMANMVSFPAHRPTA
ncbi:PIG-L family deacetylase [Carboxydochorda subterranea]|uniref:PIG-L family deacetylase n=1 Tax=Carboxydichorda subterranea TaxID=3109565 RepID=A0ABZ1BT74_9FIRM|nr:PIG-L family deacetylase [Limnochorda sp. L945t]WRP16030.1 PIG-L family deacetylase [Limnochorda sp. L945t]